MRADAAVDLRLYADQYVARMVGGQDFIGVRAHTGPYRCRHVIGGHGLRGGSRGRGCKVGDRGALGVEGIALLSGQRFELSSLLANRVLDNVEPRR